MGGGFLVVYEDQAGGDVRAQLYEADGAVAVDGIAGAVVESIPFAVHGDDQAVATAPAVAVDEDGTFFVVWTDSGIDGSGTGIAGRLFGTDADADGLAGAVDNCPLISNADQADQDGDGSGDVCDACPTGDDALDADADGTPDGCDTCTDTDQDGAGDPGFPANTCNTDNCPDVANADQLDSDNDDQGDLCDTCTDSDLDGFGDPGFPLNTCAEDNCPNDANADQPDADLDGIGDVCDVCTGNNTSGDVDGDGVCADLDCNDDDPMSQFVDGCGVCGGDNACAVFEDGFETGDLSAWTETVP